MGTHEAAHDRGGGVGVAAQRDDLGERRAEISWVSGPAAEGDGHRVIDESGHAALAFERRSEALRGVDVCRGAPEEVAHAILR